MAQKHLDCGRNIKPSNNIIVIDSFDGAEHSKSNKKRTSLISFSSQMLTPSMINLGQLTCGSRLNIFTWKQLNGTENYHNMIPAVSEYFRAKSLLYSNESQTNLPVSRQLYTQSLICQYY